MRLLWLVCSLSRVTGDIAERDGGITVSVGGPESAPNRARPAGAQPRRREAAPPPVGRKQFMFVHIPKTGGTTLVDVIKHQPGGEQNKAFHFRRWRESHADADLPHPRCFIMHVRTSAASSPSTRVEESLALSVGSRKSGFILPWPRFQSIA